MLFGVFEHVAYPRCTHTDKHFNKVGTGNGEERNLGFTGNRTRQQGLTGTWRTNHQHTVRNTATELLELGRITQELDQFLDFFLGFVATSDVGKGDRIAVLVEHAGLGFAK